MSINPNKIELEVEAGPERGRRYSVEQAGARIGRDPSNDFVVNDPSLSRFHCRIYLAGDGQARVADLGSTNTTEVNGAPINDVALLPGDRIVIGDTTLRVMGAAPRAAAVITSDAPATGSMPPPLMPAAPVAAAAAPAAAHAGATPEVPDLFGKNTAVADAAVRKHVSKTLWFVLGLVLVAAVVLVLFKLHLFEGGRNARKGAVLPALELQYEKVDATSSNIFRFELQLIGSNLSARVDILDSRELTVTRGAQAKRVVVINRILPEAFKKATDIVETFGEHELGLFALPVSPAKLIELARDAMLQGKKCFDEKEVSFGNLYKAMKAFDAAEVYLEAIDPKPDFYPDIVGGRSDAKKQLQERYDDRNFRAEKSIKIGDWQEASKNLRVILESIPNREDDRYKQAQIKLLDVERHLKPNR